MAGKVELDLGDYRQCMFFALRMWYIGGKSTLDWRRAGRRDIGDYLNDHMQGKLAELAFARLLLKRWGIEAGIDFEICPGIQVVNESDLRWITINGKRRKPQTKIDVKATTPRSKYLLIDAREFENRHYDAYVLVVLDLPRDHLIRFFASQLDLPGDLREKVEPLSSVAAEILGFAYRRDIETRGRLFKRGEWLIDPERPKKRLVLLKVDNYGLAISELRRKEEEWEQLVKIL